jgi:hypothetical protein
MTAAIIRIWARPYICFSCGEIHLLAESELQMQSANCPNPNCQADDPVVAGARQKIEIGVDQAAVRIRRTKGKS